MSHNVLQDIPHKLSEELTEVLAQGANVRIERIVSDGQTSPEDVWYDQDQNEWVLLVAGSATLEFEDSTLELKSGDHILIPSHRRHRIESTSSVEKTIWLAVFYD